METVTCEPAPTPGYPEGGPGGPGQDITTVPNGAKRCTENGGRVVVHTCSVGSVGAVPSSAPWLLFSLLAVLFWRQYRRVARAYGS